MELHQFICHQPWVLKLKHTLPPLTNKTQIFQSSQINTHPSTLLHYICQPAQIKTQIAPNAARNALESLHCCTWIAFKMSPKLQSAASSARIRKVKVETLTMAITDTWFWENCNDIDNETEMELRMTLTLSLCDICKTENDIDIEFEWHLENLSHKKCPHRKDPTPRLPSWLRRKTLSKWSRMI